jgi:predicted DNA-binding antitoxin AbrB/MazE fold protein
MVSILEGEKVELEARIGEIYDKQKGVRDRPPSKQKYACRQELCRQYCPIADSLVRFN